MKRYEKYKDSGVDWLGEIPVHWSSVRMKFLADIKTGEKDTENREDYGEYPFYVRSQTVERISTYSYDGESILTAGDGVGVGKVFHYVNGKFDYHQRVYKISDFKHINAKFLFYYMKLNFHKEVIRISAKSTVDSLRLPMLQNFPVCVSNNEEQTAIANYLDRKTTEIDQLIDQKNRLLELYAEERIAIINQAVTKGINPNVKLKDSGVDWIGEIPDGWEIKALKRFAKICNGRDHKNVWDKDGLYPIIGSGGTFGKANKFLYDQTTVLLGRKGTIDKPQYIDKPFWAVDTVYYTNIFPNVNKRFFYYLCLMINFDFYRYGSAVPSMTQETLSQIPFASPPDKSEQTAIIKHIEIETARIDAKIIKTKKLIALQKEYRAALINEVVTGKIKITK